MIGILVNNIDFRGGLEIVSERLCALFNEKNFAAKIYSMKGNKFPDVTYFNFQKKLKNSQIKDICAIFEKDSIKQLIVQLDNPFSLVANLKLFKLLTNSGIKICCCIHISPIYFVKRFYNFKDSKLLFWAKSLKTTLYFRHRAKTFFQKCVKMNVGLVSLCEGNRQELKKCFSVNSFVIPNYYEVKPFELDKCEGKKHTISYIGRIDNAHKNLFMLLDAWNAVSEKKDWTLNIIGGGDKSSLLEYAKLHNIKQLSMQEFKSPSEIEQIYKQNSILILTSRFEGYPTVIVEAVCYGNAIITTRYAGFSDELVNDGVNGYVTDFKTEEISERIQRLIDSPELLSNMQKNSFCTKRAILQNIDYVTLWKKVLEF